MSVSVKAFTIQEVAQHNTQKDVWIVIENKIYDVTLFQKQHPGGAAVLLQMAGRDATEPARAAHQRGLPLQQMAELCVGDLHTGDRIITSGEWRAANPKKGKGQKEEETSMDPPETNTMEIADALRDQLILDTDEVEAIQSSWAEMLESSGSVENAGEVLYESIFENMPALHSVAYTPRGVQAHRFFSAFAAFAEAAGDPQKLKVLTGTLAFGHLHLDVSKPKAAMFRDAVVNAIISSSNVPGAHEAWTMLLNYVGGTIVTVRMTAAEKMQVLSESWLKVNTKDEKEVAKEPSEENEEQMLVATDHKGRRIAKKTTFYEMFEVNATVMGFRTNAWMREVLNSFDAIVTHANDSPRLQEVVDVLVLRLSKRLQGNNNVDFSEYKSCMLASLRSLLSTEWDSTHEVSWHWLWDNVEQLIKRQLDCPLRWEKALATYFDGLDEEMRRQAAQQVYTRFFVVAPAAQEQLKQSDMRLFNIAEQVNQLTLRLFREPWKIVDEISGLGLRHVGFGVPTDLIGAFVTTYISVTSAVARDQLAVDAYRWSLGVIAKILTRTLSEGSTVVMKAVNANSAKHLRQAVCCVPRKLRAQCLLTVEAGSQSISPLKWAIGSGCFETAEAIFEDLLTIRADRETYYYGVDELFDRHRDIVHILCREAPQLLPTLLDGLIWRSAVPEGKLRRVNYFVRHLLVNPDGSFSKVLQWLVEAADPKILAHEVTVMVSDTLWSGVVMRQFVISKVYFILSLTNFMLTQAILPKVDDFDDKLYLVIIVMIGRCMTYFLTMLRFFFMHAKHGIQEYRSRETMKVCKCLRVPQYLRDPVDSGSLCFAIFLLLMLVQEPLIHCIGEPDWPTTSCDGAEPVRFMYSVFTMGAMTLHWFLLMDLAVFSTGLSVFCLVIGQVLSEIWRFIFALMFLLLTFGSAISVLDHSYHEMRDIPRSVVALFAITLKLYEDDYRDLQPEPALLGAVFMFVTASVIILLNLLVAQLNCSYVYIYQDMVGFARLNRAKVIVEMLEDCPQKKWDKFVKGLKLDEPLEFNRGDVGLTGGIQVKESSSLHPVVTDRILRFGGSVSPDMEWPEEEHKDDDEKDRYYRLERLVQKTLRRIVKEGHRRAAASSSGSD